MYAHAAAGHSKAIVHLTSTLDPAERSGQIRVRWERGHIFKAQKTAEVTSGRGQTKTLKNSRDRPTHMRYVI